MAVMLVNVLFDMTHRDDEVKMKILPMLRVYYDELLADSETGNVQDYIQGPGICIRPGLARMEGSDGEGDSGDTEGTVSGSA